jgi:small subunit ribosomal protein S5
MGFFSQFRPIKGRGIYRISFDLYDFRVNRQDTPYAKGTSRITPPPSYPGIPRTSQEGYRRTSDRPSSSISPSSGYRKGRDDQRGRQHEPPLDERTTHDGKPRRTLLKQEIENKQQKDYSFIYKNLREVIIQVKRVIKVTKGGKRLTFRAIIISGDRLNKVGIGVAKGESPQIAVDKATTKARRALTVVPVTKSFSVPHAVKAKYGAAKFLLMPAKLGYGITGGTVARAIFQLCGIKNAITKQIGKGCVMNNANVVIEALRKIKFETYNDQMGSNKKREYYRKLLQ